MSLNNDSKFDIDLEFGNNIESMLQKIMSSKSRIEIKTEVTQWKKWRNLAVEIKYRGKRSGLAVTKADWWLHALYCEEVEDVVFSIFMPTIRFKKLVKDMVKAGLVKRKMGGDDKESELLLIPIDQITKFVN